MKNEIIKVLNAKLKEQDMATDKYDYRCGIFDCIKLIEKLITPKIVVWKDGSSKIIFDGITHEYENDNDWLTTISL